jgi:hypothetical protein
LRPQIQKISKDFALILSVVLILSACSPRQANGAGPTAQVQASAENQPPIATIIPTQPQGSAPAAETQVESNIGACTLVTREEASAAVGSSVGEAVEEDYPPLFGCRYQASALEFVSISLAVFDDAQQAAGAFQSEIDLSQYEEINGIGDRALKPAILDIEVLKGRYSLSIGVVNSSDEETRFEQAKKLALLALTRLP